MHTSRNPVALGAALILLVPAALARADVVKNISTGFDQVAGTKVANGAADADWVIGAGSAGGFAGQTTIARSAPLPSPYLADGASAASRWIGINSNQGLEGISVPAGVYFFQATVDLTGYDASTAAIANSRFAIDDGLQGIRINGNTIYTLPDGRVQTRFDEFETVLPPDLGAGAFQPGVNTITFVLENAVSGTPVAFRFEGNVIAAVPEPGGAAVFVVGLAGAFVRRRWRKY
jgi:hypothetical protein